MFSSLRVGVAECFDRRLSVFKKNLSRKVFHQGFEGFLGKISA